MKFSQLFQNKVQQDGLVEYGIESLLEYVDESYLAQFEVNPVRVKSLIKDIVKNGLWQNPTVLNITDDDATVIGGGRHRITAIANIMDTYGVAATGKTVLRTPENDADLDEIEDGVLCSVVTVKTRADAVAWLVSNNGSRSMSAAEKMEGELYCGSISKLKERQRALANQLSAGLFGHITITPETARALASALAKLVGKKFAWIPDALIQELAKLVVNTFIANADAIDSNFARTGYKQLVELVGAEAVQFTDSEGDLVTGNIFQKLDAAIQAPAKGTKAKKDETADALAKATTVINELKAKLAAAGLV